jgi:phenylpropionate dioxygenase-like ring-hydroxylating dioxygenase large terminal subunit
MLSTEDNSLLTRVSKGTAMNNLFRRFWLPVLLAAELPTPDCPPVRVRVLDEELVAFRDTNGRVGLLDQRCPHRHANLFWGRNEDGGLRCVYHGWKFDVTGRCVDIPNAIEGESFKEKIHAFAAYPAVDNGGLIWAYLGPPELEPQLPHFDFAHVADNQRFVRKMLLPGNYLQIMEGDVDSSHVSFLHHAGVAPKGVMKIAGAASPYMVLNRQPHWEIENTDYGVRLAARRDAEPDTYYWRVNQWCMPSYAIIAAEAEALIHINIRVPVSDTETMYFRLWWHPERPLTELEVDELESGGVIMPDMIPGTFLTAENMRNDYLIDRSKQGSGASYTGIKSISAQDFAVQEDQGGPIMDRSLEHLVSSDAAIIAVRKRLLDATKALADGVEPPEAADGDLYRVRSLDTILPRDVPLAVGGRDLMTARV